jgi:hypothetical protein
MLTSGSFDGCESPGCLSRVISSSSSRIFASLVVRFLRDLAGLIPAFTFAASVMTGAAGCAFLLRVLVLTTMVVGNEREVVLVD